MRVITKSYPVFDCDAHVVDPLAIWDYLAESDRDLVRDHGYWSDTNYRGLAFLNGSRQGGTAQSRNIIMGSSHGGPGMKPEITRALRLMNLTDDQIDYLEFKGAHQPDARVQELDMGGIDQVLVIPTQLNGYFPFVENIYAARAMARAYNDWAHDYCAYDPERLFWAALLPIQFGPMAADEVYRVAERGARVVLVRPIDANGNYPSDPSLDMLWRACEETGVVVGVHTFPSGNISGRGGGYPANWATGTQHSPGELMDKSWQNTGMFQGMISQDWSFIWESMTWTNGVLMSGFLDRYPKLKMAIFESNSTWLPMVLEECDRAAKLHARERMGGPLKRLPSQAFRDQCLIAFESDEIPVYRMWKFYEDLCLWSSDHYHHDAEDAWEAIEHMNELGVPEEAQAKLMGENARRAYGVEPKLFVTESRYDEIVRPDWFPSEEQVAAVQGPQTAPGPLGGSGPRFAVGRSYHTLHERPEQFLPHHRARPGSLAQKR